MQGLVSRGLPARLLEAAGMFAATEERFSACVLAAVAGISAPTLGRCLGELGANLSCRVKGPPPVTVRALGGTGDARRYGTGQTRCRNPLPTRHRSGRGQRHGNLFHAWRGYARVPCVETLARSDPSP